CSPPPVGNLDHVRPGAHAADRPVAQSGCGRRRAIISHPRPSYTWAESLEPVLVLRPPHRDLPDNGTAPVLVSGLRDTFDHLRRKNTAAPAASGMAKGAEGDSPQ